MAAGAGRAEKVASRRATCGHGPTSSSVCQSACTTIVSSLDRPSSVCFAPTSVSPLAPTIVSSLGPTIVSLLAPTSVSPSAPTSVSSLGPTSVSCFFTDQRQSACTDQRQSACTDQRQFTWTHHRQSACTDQRQSRLHRPASDDPLALDPVVAAAGGEVLELLGPAVRPRDDRRDRPGRGGRRRTSPAARTATDSSSRSGPSATA